MYALTVFEMTPLRIEPSLLTFTVNSFATNFSLQQPFVSNTAIKGISEVAIEDMFVQSKLFIQLQLSLPNSAQYVKITN